MNDKQLLRYARHITLDNIGIYGQSKLLKSTVLVIGVGGIGAPASIYLATSGIGNIILLDYDKIELSNLGRQITYSTNDIGKSKVLSAKKKLLQLNPEIKITTYTNITNAKLAELVCLADIVLDGTDNFKTRFKVNEICITKKTPLVSSAVIGYTGQLAVFKGYMKDKPCYHCLYDKDKAQDDDTCTNNGVLAPVAGILGTMGATMIIKTLLNIGNILDEQLLLFDALDMTTRTIKLTKDPYCRMCNIFLE